MFEIHIQFYKKNALFCIMKDTSICHNESVDKIGRDQSWSSYMGHDSILQAFRNVKRCDK